MDVPELKKGELPYYVQVREYVRGLIDRGQLRPGDKVPTEVELARMFGVSLITSKRALSDLEIEGLIKREQGRGSFVLERPRSAQERANVRFMSIVLPYIQECGFQIVSGAEMYLRNEGYHLTFSCSDYDVLKEEATLERLVADGVLGIILYPVQTATISGTIRKLVQNGYPLVFIDRAPRNLEVSSVVSDNFGGAYKLTTHLIKIGHRRIAFVSTRVGNATSIEERFRGYAESLSAHGIELDESLLVTNYPLKYNFPRDMRNLIPESYVEQALDTLMGNEHPPTAIVCVNDWVAIELIREAGLKGIKVPEELAIVGFDDVELAANVEVPLTTVRQSFSEMGEHAARLLIKAIRAKASGTDRIPQEKVVIPTELVLRKSCGRNVTGRRGAPSNGK